MKVGYARVSSIDQNLDNQIEALNAFGFVKIFQEKQSGKSAENREQLQQALDFLRAMCLSSLSFIGWHAQSWI